MDVRIFETADGAAHAVAQRIGDAIGRQSRLVLGLPAGRTPIPVYADLRRRHAAGAADFTGVLTFNLDEFVGIEPSHRGSFRTFMTRELFAGVNLPPSQIHFLNGAASDLDAECDRYERAIDGAGGIDLLLLGIGRNGHIGFNEPAEALAARTHRLRLADSSRRDNAGLFGGDWTLVPREALSMGMGTILNAATIVLMATGARKATCVARALRGGVTTALPASFLQLHRRVEVYLDHAAASGLE